MSSARPASMARGADPKTTSARIIARLVSIVAGLRAVFGASRLQLCQRAARNGLAAID
jgi:hypothetical protein